MIKPLAFIFLFVLLLFINIAPSFASYMNKDTVGNRKERQLVEKIQAIHDVFPNQTDEAALYATLAHRGTLTDYVNESYDPNFNTTEYKNIWNDLLTDINSVLENVGQSITTLGDAIVSGAECLISGGTDDEGNQYQTDCVLEKVIEKYSARLSELGVSNSEANIKKADGIDLLVAATIVMLDSSGWTGNYSDENYQYALAGTGLVGNMFDKNDGLQNLASMAMNGVFCTVGMITDVTLSSFNPGFSLNNGSFGVEENAMAGKLSRYYTMATICKKGFIGGTYSNLKDLDQEYIDEHQDQYQTRKDIIAQEIIDLAIDFRERIAQDGDLCLTDGNTQASVFMDMTTDEYIATMGPIAQADYSRTNVFASVTLAQSIIESGWGKSGLTQQANNMFGIKCSSNWDGECINMATGEYGSGGYYMINDAFRKYNSIEASVSDHSQFLIENSRYSDAGAFTATSYAEQIRAIHRAGYATAPDYSESIINTIQTYNLDKWDVKSNTTSSNDICAPVGLGGWTIRSIAPSASDSAFNYVSSNRGQCVWYAQGRAIEIVEELGKTGKLTEEQINHIRDLLLVAPGNGGEIYDNAKARGNFNTSDDIKQPKAGSYIVWKEAGNYGHVAVIEEVNTTDNTITITEGWSNNGASCPSSWDCVSFQSRTMDLDSFYSGFGQSYTGNYTFSGYVYFLEPLV